MKKKIDAEERVCAFCRLSTAICGRDEMLCQKKGIVPLDYSCRAFGYDPLKRVPRRVPSPDMPELPEI